MEQCGNTDEKYLPAACSRHEAIRQKSNGSRLDFYLRAICRVKYRAVDKENEAGEKKFSLKENFGARPPDIPNMAGPCVTLFQ